MCARWQEVFVVLQSQDEANLYNTANMARLAEPTDRSQISGDQNMNTGKLTPEKIAAYHKDGFIIARKFFDKEEIDLLRKAAKEDRTLDQHSFSKDDGGGAKV